MSKCNVCGKEMRAGTEHVRPDLATVCSSCAKRPFDYQQWRTASVVTPKMLDSCLDRIAELEARLNTMSQSYVDTLKRAEQAEARCKELAEETADRIGALLKAEAALAERDRMLKQATEDYARWRRQDADDHGMNNVPTPGAAEYLSMLRDMARAEEGSHDNVPTDQQIRDARMDEAIPLEEDFS